MKYNPLSPFLLQASGLKHKFQTKNKHYEMVVPDWNLLFFLIKRDTHSVLSEISFQKSILCIVFSEKYEFKMLMLCE